MSAVHRTGRVSLLLILAVATATCARPAPPTPAAPAPSVERGLVTKPVSFAILEDYDEGDDLRDVARDFALFRELGVTTWRGSLSWLQLEPMRGRYVFDWVHRFAMLAADSGITLRPYVAYTPEWAARGGGTDGEAWNDPPRNMHDWAAFVDTLARAMRRHSNVRSFEIYNEENTTQWWDGSAASYDSVLALGAAAVRAADPDAQLLLGGMVWPDAAWTSNACRASRVDVVPFHAYPETWTPESVSVESYLHDFGYAGFIAAMRAQCGDVPVWINETGFATVPGKTERDQALWWARAIPTFLAVPAVQHIGIYELKDLPSSAPAIGGAPNYHLGLTYADRRKKLAFATVRLLVRLLDAGTLTITDSALAVAVTGGAPGELHVHGFLRPDGRQVLFAWDKGGNAEIRVGLPRAGRIATVYDLDGTSRRVAGFDGRTLAGLRLVPGDVRIVEVTP